MAENLSSSAPGSADQPSNEALREEIRRLRAHIRELQSELSERTPRRARSRRRRDDDDFDDDRERRRDPDRERDLPARAADEASKLVRSVTLASLEQLRLMADVVGTFADEVFRRNRPSRSGDRDLDDDEYDDDDDVGRDRFGDRLDDDDAYAVDAERSEEEEEDRRRRGGERRRGRRTIQGLTRDLPGDVYSGLVNAVEESLSVPRRVVDRFHDAYRESDEAEPSRPRSEARRERARARSLRRESDRLEREADAAQRRAGEREDVAERRDAERDVDRDA